MTSIQETMPGSFSSNKNTKTVINGDFSCQIMFVREWKEEKKDSATAKIQMCETHYNTDIKDKSNAIGCVECEKIENS